MLWGGRDATFLPSFSDSTMPSTMRLYINDKRISTAVRTKSGAILQVYPEKRTFGTDVAWRLFWDEATKPKILLRTTDTGKGVSRPPRRRASSLADWKIIKCDDMRSIFSPGSYYIGDLCYALSDEVYDKIFGGGGYASGIYREKGPMGRTFLVSRTAYGDGVYKGSDGKTFLVDAGIIGICPVSLMEKSGEGGHVYTFKDFVECNIDGGLYAFTSGHKTLVIDTAGNN